jgi:hypothetical protein
MLSPGYCWLHAVQKQLPDDTIAMSDPCYVSRAIQTDGGPMLLVVGRPHCFETICLVELVNAVILNGVCCRLEPC